MTSNWLLAGILFFASSTVVVAQSNLFEIEKVAKIKIYNTKKIPEYNELDEAKMISNEENLAKLVSLTTAKCMSQNCSRKDLTVEIRFIRHEIFNFKLGSHYIDIKKIRKINKDSFEIIYIEYQSI